MDQKRLNIYIDIDNTIARGPEMDYDGIEDYPYQHAQPIPENIEKANKLYEAGHKITYWTGRGGTTGIDWYDLTESQLDRWGCKYHDLIVGVEKPWDLIIDDKVLNTEDWNERRIQKFIEND